MLQICKVNSCFNNPQRSFR